MTKAVHTPGPWNVFAPKFKAGRGIGPSSKWIVARTTPCRDGAGQHHSKANARLIAAAPDLLAALIFLSQQVAKLPQSEFSKNDNIAPALIQSDKAIAKARGQS